jgi:hypothetical protein
MPSPSIAHDTPSKPTNGNNLPEFKKRLNARVFFFGKREKFRRESIFRVYGATVRALAGPEGSCPAFQQNFDVYLFEYLNKRHF